MLLLLFASQIAMPVATNARTMFSPDAVPDYLLLEHEKGVRGVSVAVTVDPSGRVQGCDVERTSGIAKLDALTCAIILRRGRFRPAMIDGSPAYGVQRATIRWAVVNDPSEAKDVTWPDAEVQVQALPKGLKSPVQQSVMFKVAPDGSKSGCAAHPDPLFTTAKNHPALVSVACVQLGSGKARPARDAAGNPQVSVQNAIVRFSTGKKR